MNDVILGIVGTLAGGIVGGAAGYFGSIRNAKLLIGNEKAQQVSAQKRAVIADLIGYRFVLTPKHNNPAADMAFNAALGRAVVEFSHCKRCMDEYRSLGDSFTAEKFYNFIKALMDDVPLESQNIDKHLLENVPAKR